MRRRLKLGPRMMFALLIIFGGLYMHASVYGTPKPILGQAESPVPAAGGATEIAKPMPHGGEGFHYFPLFTDPHSKFTPLEIVFLFISLLTAIAALVYAGMLV